MEPHFSMSALDIIKASGDFKILGKNKDGIIEIELKAEQSMAKLKPITEEVKQLHKT
jgi:hypothetical protein